jgi:hypothetical protein
MGDAPAGESSEGWFSTLTPLFATIRAFHPEVDNDSRFSPLAELTGEEV